MIKRKKIAYKKVVHSGIKIRTLFLFIGIGVCISFNLHSQYVEVRTELDTNQVLIGDQFKLNIHIDYPTSLNVGIPVLRDTLTGKIEILDMLKSDTTVLDGDRIAIDHQYLLTSFDSGFYIIPPLAFELSQDDWKDTLFSNPLYLAVYTIPLDTAGRIFDIKAPLGAPLSIAEVLPYATAGLLLLGVIVFTFYYVRRKKKKVPLLKFSRPEEPPHIIALRELDKLKEEKLWQKNLVKPYYTRLTEIIRTYIERLYHIPAMELTSEETLEAWLKYGNQDPDLHVVLKSLLNLADLVKFAKEKPLPSDNEINLTNAYEFVHKTKPVPRVFDEKDEGGERKELAAVGEHKETMVNE